MYERNPDAQAILWIKQFGYLEPKSDELIDRIVEYSAVYKAVFGRKPSTEFQQSIQRKYIKAGIIKKQRQK